MKEGKECERKEGSRRERRERRILSPTLTIDKTKHVLYTRASKVLVRLAWCK